MPRGRKISPEQTRHHPPRIGSARSAPILLGAAQAAACASSRTSIAQAVRETTIRGPVLPPCGLSLAGPLRAGFSLGASHLIRVCIQGGQSLQEPDLLLF